MIKLLTGKHQKKIAWVLLFVFYGEFLGAAFASRINLRGYFEQNGYDRVSFFPNVNIVSKQIADSNAVHEFESKKKPVTDDAELPAISAKEEEPEVSLQNPDDIGGPGQPEMSTFKSIGADNMVNLFTGDFSYNIPLLDVGGYPVNLFYNAGVTMDQEASWVGLGWNINPGTISRNMRGLPDDYNGDDVVTKTQSMKPDVTVGVSGNTGKEIIGKPGYHIGAGIFYNNRRGVGLEADAGFDYSPLKHIAVKSKDEKAALPDSIPKYSISGGVTLNSQNGLSLDLGFTGYKYIKEAQINTGLSTSVGFNSREGVTGISISAELNKYWLREKDCKGGGTEYQSRRTNGNLTSISISFARPTYTPTIRMPLTTVNQLYSVKLGTERKILFKNGTISGYLNETKISKTDQVQTKPAFGYMYAEKATDNKDALLDFNRLQDGVYTLKKPVISIPAYTYDVFSISGEGTGGSFRGYRGNMGYVRDNYTKTRSRGLTVSTDLGFRDLFHGGTILGGALSSSEVNEWKDGNALRYKAQFDASDAAYHGFYFRNPGEQAIVDETYYNKMGGDQLVRPYLENIHSALPLLSSGFQVFGDDGKVERTIIADGTSKRNTRDKRTQVITYLTAEEADRVGLDRNVYSYKENTFLPGSCANTSVRTSIKRYIPGNPLFYRKGNHLSEIDVLEADGRRYIYGIPVYVIKQNEVTFSINPGQGNATTQQTTYTDEQRSTSNTSGQDGLYENTETNGYAHSFLLTGILSPDYVDVTGDGITDDDKGTAVRFNYSRVNMKKALLQNTWNSFKWRMPAGGHIASYNEGLKADPQDDKGLFTYGEKELWYMHSIESKNMVATFYISERRDGNPVTDLNGGRDTRTGRTMQMKLEKINLYTKADYVRYGSNARPVKTVHFDYDYTLCRDYVLNDGLPYNKPGSSTNYNQDHGKLTLKAIWFSYNGNDNQVRNRYRFEYSAANPAYNSAENDRWGNYKDHFQNPEQEPGIKAGNNDYPYTLQNTNSNTYAAAWALKKILLPGGAVMEVQYEADDYGYVQNKRASQMTLITGFGSAPNSNPDNKLYTWNPTPTMMASPALADHRFVFFDLSQALTDRNEIAQKYLRDMKQLLLKLWVKMPRGNIGENVAYEPVTIYGRIKNYDFARDPTTNAIMYNRFYVELEPTSRGGSPIMETVMQFLKDYLPSRAYPGYNVKKDNANGLVQLVRAVFGMMSSLFQGVMGFEKSLKTAGKCREVKSAMSFARLNNPTYKKIGGGHRVKEVRIKDNWNRMTGQFDSEYGQLYDYTTTENINGQSVIISSGVATYEPGVGNEENPFREVLAYSDKQFLGPTDHNNIELPLAEMFFPSPMVGYSKVSVKSIHNKDNKNIKSGIGFQQTEFYTSRDFPVISDYTPFDQDSRQHHKPGPIQKVFNFDKRDYMTLTQGVRVVLNDMNGKLRSQTSYAENDLKTPINYTGYYYRLKPIGDNKYKLDNKVPVISGPDGKISQQLIGRDVEVMNDFREHISYTRSANIPLNVDIFKVGTFPIIIPTIFRMIFRDKSMYRAATTLKVVNEYGIVDSVVNIDKGSVVGTKNLVFDAETGGVLITRTNNEFKKPLYQFNYPAWWVNSGMEPAYKNIDAVYNNVLFRNGRIESGQQDIMNIFESGDEIYAVDKSNKGVAQSIGCVTLGDPPLLPQSDEYRIWAIDIRKDTRNTEKEFIFLDRNGNPYNAANASIRIIRSGKRNMTGVSAGSIVSLNSPIKQVVLLGQTLEYVQIDNNTDVINAGAAEFKEKWRTNDMFYAKDSVLRIVRQAPILSSTVTTTSSASFGEFRYHTGGLFGSWHRVYELFQDPSHFIAAHYNNGGSQPDYRHRSWLLFNFDNVPNLNSSSIILSAALNMPSHQANHNVYISGQYTGTSHSTVSPHYSFPNHDNRFILSRMLSTWPSFSNWNAWKQQYQYSPPNGSSYQMVVQGTSPQWSNLNYSNVNITSLVKAMLKDKYDPLKNYATAVRANILTDWATHTGGVARVCFDKTQSRYPTIDMKYYNCDANNPIIYQGNAEGAPSVPPAGYVFCNTDEIVKLCLSSFSKQRMNPYVEGVLGNWRAWRSYVYYGERRESNPTVPTDIRKDGIIKDFEPYWAFDNNNIQLGKTNSSKWVWNSEITQYNRKGAELEDHDPLGRYNAGIYGYQESLPIAVVNNSRLRLSAFDGFEDYFYKDDPCEPYCKPFKRHFPTAITSAMLDSLQAHTGTYSAKVNANTSFTIDVKTSEDDTEVNPDIKIELNKTPVQQVTQVFPKGVGLKGYYYNHDTWGGTPVIREDPSEPLRSRDINLAFKKGNNQGCDNREFDDPPAPVRCYDMSVRWKGKVQVTATGYYEFLSSGADDEAYIHINGVQVATDTWAGVHTRTPVYLIAGALNDIQVDFRQFGGIGRIQLQWKVPGQNRFVPIDMQYLYPEGKEYLANGTTVTQTVYCVKPGQVQAINHHLIDSFNLVSGKKMVISTWVRKGSQDCKCSNYTGIQIKVKDANGNPLVDLQPKEKIIEGWQQYEAVFFVPSGNKVKLEFNAPADAALYFDDLRLHPFNANMKSFVYDPVTLRLTAELDENNYASFYEYDDEGTLVRVKKETIKGIKTITETRSATQKTITDFQ